MKSKTDVQELIKKLKTLTGFTQQQIAIKAGYKPNSITQALSKNDGVDAIYRQLQIAFKIELEKPTSIKKGDKGINSSVALHTAGIDAGLKVTIQDSPDYIEGYITMPGIGANDGSWLVSGSSMEPTIRKGSRVIIRKINNLDVILWNEIYVVDLVEHGAKVKRIKQGSAKGKLILISDNKEYPDVEVSSADFYGIYRVLMIFEMI